jgi:hypothetical protein
VPLPFLSKPSALQRLAASRAAYKAGPIGDDVIRDAVDELRAARPMERVKLAKKAGLPHICVAIGAQSNPLLAVLLDDDTLLRAVGEPTARVWLQVDGAACIAHVLARAQQVSPAVLLIVLADARVDKTEAFEVLAPRYRSDAALREALTRGYFPGAPSMRSTLSDPRFVELALERLRDEPGSSCRLLGVNGSERAIDELRALLDGATTLDAIALAAVDGLELALTQQQLLDLLAALLATSPLFATSTPVEIAEGPLGFKIGVVHGYAFMQHRAVQRSPRLQEILEVCAQTHPMPVVG